MPDLAKSPSTPAVSLWRRLAAMTYDCLAVFAACYAAGAVAVGLQGGHPIGRDAWWFKLYLLCVIYAYFAYCWRHGQTLGMRSWKIKLVDSASGGAVSWSQTAQRFAVALVSWLALGLGVLWAAWDLQHRTWHDIVSRSALVRC